MNKTLLLLTVLFTAPAFAEPVNINKADAATIAKSLNGVGLKKAEAIVQYRTDKGEFKSVDDLANVAGIGAKTIEKNKADIFLSDSTKQ
ncbi:MAG: hypothetical protein Kow0065_06190 [Methylomicrobium sp.]